jgi:hypothetical protein
MSSKLDLSETYEYSIENIEGNHILTIKDSEDETKLKEASEYLKIQQTKGSTTLDISKTVTQNIKTVQGNNVIEF